MRWASDDRELFGSPRTDLRTPNSGSTASVYNGPANLWPRTPDYLVRHGDPLLYEPFLDPAADALPLRW